MTENRDVVGNIANEDKYIETSKMDQAREYATEVELFATATLLNTAIWTYSPYARRKKSTLYRWQKYSPLQQGTTAFEPSPSSIYLNNKGEHFEPVLGL